MPLIHAQLVNVKAGSLTNLATRSDVLYISPNRPVRGALDKVVTAVNEPDLVAPGNRVVSHMGASNNTLVTANPGLAVYPCNNWGNYCGPQYGSAKYIR